MQNRVEADSLKRRGRLLSIRLRLTGASYDFGVLRSDVDPGIQRLLALISR